MLRSFSAGACFAALLLVAAGCGGVDKPTLYGVKGKVTYNGSPVADAEVQFQSEKGGAGLPRARTDAEGNYSITTNGDPGAPNGTYTVRVTKTPKGANDVVPDADENADPASMGNMAEMMKNRSGVGADGKVDRNSQNQPQNELPAKYADMNSPLQANVENKEMNEINFELTD